MAKMSFSLHWLDLREPADRRARSPELLAKVVDEIGRGSVDRIADLGAGTGSMFRFLAPFISPEIPWSFYDSVFYPAAGAAFDRVPEHKQSKISRHQIDLAHETVDYAPRMLVCASAFFDLVSEPWLERFTTDVVASGAMLYSTLSVDGRHELNPAHVADEQVLASFREHQTRVDKGFGVPLGPLAHRRLVDLLKHKGYEVVEAASDWDLYEAELLALFIDGIAEAALMFANPQDVTHRWLHARRAEIEENRLTVRVGHRDLFAVPASGPSRF
ncbi:MAG: hypothetical protein AAFZ38_01010 [Myxococcota bacterium]